MFTLTMLKAGNGDAIWLTFGTSEKQRHILVDAGPAKAQDAISQHVDLLRGEKDCTVEIDLLIVTHSDGDHINGAYWLMRNQKKLRIKIKSIWFNGYREIFGSDSLDLLGYKKAEQLSALTEYLGIRHNEGFSGEPVARAGDDDFPCTCIDGLRLTVLSPTVERLKDLREDWSKATKKAPGKTYRETLKELESSADDTLGASSKPGSDNSPPNGSSIALVVEYEEAAVLLAGDAFAGDIQTSLSRLRTLRKVGQIDFFKLSHHGCVANITDSLVTCVAAPHYLISTDGATHNHPDVETFQIILRNRPSEESFFHFNYEPVRERIRKVMNDNRVSLGSEPTQSGMRLDLVMLRAQISGRYEHHGDDDEQ
ncbi:MBL fold metallo-hydrolase [Paraburkholderia sp. BCC1876]|jgi:Predicted hydrolase (metallo-beta-lactamase superfamily)|uniref:ComEC/Rec2 family competence protein n=1 Tax=Paraburkholderia sp. BCC1876 TaxID=2676303 RepID=UPI0015909D69|nr:MBL fold metallo-hydrolase [Paraburkholderia sp. BCC1876]